MSNYHEWCGFRHIYLEDSFVIEINEKEDELSFVVDAVLTEDHPLYSSPTKDEQYCYQKCRIIFREVESVDWSNRNLRPSVDADGTEDLGNIDAFVYSREQYRMEGDWGELLIRAGSLHLSWVI